jgi:hypothetical protein
VQREKSPTPIWEGPLNELDDVLTTAYDRLSSIDENEMKSFYGTGRGKSGWKYGSPMLVSFVKEVESRAPKNVTQFEGFQNNNKLAQSLGFEDEYYFNKLYSSYMRVSSGVYSFGERGFLRWSATP